MRSVASGSAPAKLILSGEHAVVHGHLAIAVAIDRRTTVTLRRRPGPTVLGTAPFADARVLPALLAVLPEHGLQIDITTTIPVGRGLGSSAALAVATVRAWAALEGQPCDFQRCHTDGFAIERVFHGTPSGVDHAVSALAGAITYRRTEGQVELAPLPCPALQLVVLDTGSLGNTAELVAGVRARRPQVDPVLRRIGALTEQIRDVLRSGVFDRRALGALLTENHRLLAQIGVSTPALDALVQLALDHGAHGAKLAGAGGGGVVLALCDEPGPVLAAAHNAAVPATFAVKIVASETP